MRGLKTMKKAKTPPFKLKVTPINKGKTIEDVMRENNYRDIVEKIIVTKEALIDKNK